MSAQKLARIAVLIDAQNVPCSLASIIFERINELGTTSVRRVYADWSEPESGGWKACLQRFALQPMQQFSHVSSKDVADMALIIDAMDLLHSGQHDGFCIVSSDSDFTGLAIRIRQQGIRVFGLGEAKTQKTFQEACDRFMVLTKAQGGQTAARDLATGQKGNRAASDAVPRGKGASVALPSKAPLSGADLDLLRQAIMAKAGTDGWADVASVGSYLAQNTPLDIRKHAANLSKLLRVSSIAEVGEPSSKPGTQLRVRLRSVG